MNISSQMGSVFCSPFGATVHVADDLLKTNHTFEEKRNEELKNSGRTDVIGNKEISPKNQSTWNYDEKDNTFGPTSWPTGDCQSPVDFKISSCELLTLEKDPLQFVNYSKQVYGQFYNNGNSVQFQLLSQLDAPEIYGGFLNQRYRFIQYHYHWSENDRCGSEHSIGGLFYSAELHIVHQGLDDPSKLAVLAVFLTVENDSDDSNIALNAEDNSLSAVTTFNTRCDAKLYLEDKLPRGSSFIRYEGSLTTPPCSENVTWTIFTDAMKITTQQMAALRLIRDKNGELIRCNCRPTQKLNHRKMFLAL